MIEARTTVAVRWASGVLPLVFAAVFLVFVGRGIDFGDHWDEGALVDKVAWSITSGGILLPPTYDWPSASYWVALAALAPELPALNGLASADLSRFEQRLLTSLAGADYQLRLRWLFGTLAALSIVWVFAASRALGGGLPEASMAAAILALAWEPSYHARFPAPDGLLMQFGALTLWCTVGAAHQPLSKWLFGAAAAAGLAVGTKYAAWPLLVPIIWIAASGGGPFIERVRRIARVGAIAVGAFLVTTPGALLMPAHFAQALVLQWRHYATGHGVHTVNAGLDHLWRMLEYLALELLSPYAAIAAAFAALAMMGVWILWRQAPALAVAVAAFPVAYVLYFSLQRVMIVRNLIIVAPFFAVAAARGLGAVGDLLPHRLFRTAPYAIAAIALATNGVFAARAASAIETRHALDMGAAAHAWLEHSDAATVGVSPSVQQAIGHRVVPDVTADEGQSRQWLTFLGEPVCGEQLPANVRGLITLVAGPREVNVTRYPDWAGDRHLVVVDLAKLRREGRCGGTSG